MSLLTLLQSAGGGGSVSVNVTGLSATGQVGSVTVLNDFTVLVTGVSATGAVGTVTALTGATVFPTGV